MASQPDLLFGVKKIISIVIREVRQEILLVYQDFLWALRQAVIPDGPAVDVEATLRKDLVRPYPVAHGITIMTGRIAMTWRIVSPALLTRLLFRHPAKKNKFGILWGSVPGLELTRPQL